MGVAVIDDHGVSASARAGVEGMIDAGIPLDDVEFRIGQMVSLTEDQREWLMVWAWAWQESAARWAEGRYDRRYRPRVKVILEPANPGQVMTA